MKSRWYMIIGLLLVGLLLSGCYTVLKHPKAVNDEGLTSDYYDPDACAHCHVDGSFYNYGYEDYYSHYQPLLEYYGRPWWWDAYWGDEWYYEENGGWRPNGIKDSSRDRGFVGSGISGSSGTSHGGGIAPATSKSTSDSRQASPANSTTSLKDQSRVKKDAPSNSKKGSGKKDSDNKSDETTQDKPDNTPPESVPNSNLQTN